MSLLTWTCIKEKEVTRFLNKKPTIKKQKRLDADFYSDAAKIGLSNST